MQFENILRNCGQYKAHLHYLSPFSTTGSRNHGSSVGREQAAEKQTQLEVHSGKLSSLVEKSESSFSTTEATVGIAVKLCKFQIQTTAARPSTPFLIEPIHGLFDVYLVE
jgi:hypothetical protein